MVRTPPMLRIQLTDGGTMFAFHIVGQNLELRHRMRVCFGRKEEVLVALRRIGFLSVFGHDHQTVEYAAGLVIQNSFIKLVAGAVRFLMINHGMRLDHLAPATDIQAIQNTLGVFAGQAHVDRIADLGAAHQKDMRVKRRIAGGFHFHKGMVIGMRAFQHNFVVRDARLGRDRNKRFGLGCVGFGAAALIFLNERYFLAFGNGDVEIPLALFDFNVRVFGKNRKISRQGRHWVTGTAPSSQP